MKPTNEIIYLLQQTVLYCRSKITIAFLLSCLIFVGCGSPDVRLEGVWKSNAERTRTLNEEISTTWQSLPESRKATLLGLMGKAETEFSGNTIHTKFPGMQLIETVPSNFEVTSQGEDFVEIKILLDESEGAFSFGPNTAKLKFIDGGNSYYVENSMIGDVYEVFTRKGGSASYVVNLIESKLNDQPQQMTPQLSLSKIQEWELELRDACDRGDFAAVQELESRSIKFKDQKKTESMDYFLSPFDGLWTDYTKVDFSKGWMDEDDEDEVIPAIIIEEEEMAGFIKILLYYIDQGVKPGLTFLADEEEAEARKYRVADVEMGIYVETLLKGMDSVIRNEEKVLNRKSNSLRSLKKVLDELDIILLTRRSFPEPMKENIKTNQISQINGDTNSIVQ